MQRSTSRGERPNARSAVRRLAFRAVSWSCFPSTLANGGFVPRPTSIAFLLHCVAATVAAAQVIAIKAGRLVDPDAGTVAVNQVMLVERGKFTAIGANVAIPAGAQVIDLTGLTVVPGLVDAHNHLALTYKEVPERNSYYITSVLD